MKMIGEENKREQLQRCNTPTMSKAEGGERERKPKL